MFFLCAVLKHLSMNLSFRRCCIKRENAPHKGNVSVNDIYSFYPGLTMIQHLKCCIIMDFFEMTKSLMTV